MSASRHPSRPKLRVSSLAKTQQRRRPSALIWGLLVLLWSIGLGWGLASVGRSQQAQDIWQAPHIGTVDPIPERYQTGQALYLEACASCHIGVPPAVFPTETWRDLLLDENHYGQRIEVLPPRKFTLSGTIYRPFPVPKQRRQSPFPFAFAPPVPLRPYIPM